MTSIRRYARLYRLLCAQYLKSRMSYRTDFLVSLVFMLLWFLPSFFSVVVLFANIPSLAGWSLEELVFVYGFYVMAMAPNGLFFQQVWQLPTQIRNGGFIKYYFRPLNMMFYFMSEVIDVNSLNGIPIGAGLMIWASIRLGIAWTAARIALTLVLLASASLVVCALMVASASTAFWLTNAHSLLNLASRFRENARYPMTIYNGGFRLAFSVLVPIGFMAFYPSQLIIRPQEAGIIPWLTPVAGVASFALACLVWSRGARKWSGTGT
jgi:ABC-2 type transport system permease protein